MAKILNFPDKNEQLTKKLETLINEGIDLGWTDNKIEKLLEDIQNLPSDEEELIRTLHDFHRLEKETFQAMSVKNYEKFFYIKVGIETMLENIKTGAYKHDFE